MLMDLLLPVSASIVTHFLGIDKGVLVFCNTPDSRKMSYNKRLYVPSFRKLRKDGIFLWTNSSWRD